MRLMTLGLSLVALCGLHAFGGMAYEKAAAVYDGVVVKSSTGSGMYEWTPPQGERIYPLTHVVTVNGTPVGETLRAIFSVPSYSINFNGSGAQGTMSPMTCIPGRVYKLTANAFDGGMNNRFVGWTDGKKKLYEDQMLVFDLANAGESVTLSAVWEKAFDLGGVQLWENGPYWATCNVGATKPEEYGYYFWWGDTVGYTLSDGTWTSDWYYSGVTWASSTGASMSSSPFQLSTCPTCGRSNSTLQSEGYIDSTGNLVAAHDAATAHLGSPWRMPTDAEWDALINNCDTEWTTRNGVYGRLVTGRGGYSSKSIFLPAAGLGGGPDLVYPGSHGYYWSSTPYSDSSDYAWRLYFDSDDFHRSNSRRDCGQSVRPVRGFAQ